MERTGRSARSAPWARSASTRRRTSLAARAARSCCNDPRLIERAEILQEKGTDRSSFFRGQVDKYSWVDVGSSYLPSEINAAFLWAQLEQATTITDERLRVWHTYNEALEELEVEGALRRPMVPAEARHNAHMYYVLLPSLAARTAFIAGLAERGVHGVFHYVPLHDSVAGRRYGRAHGSLARTEDLSDRLVRLPLWMGMSDADVNGVIDAVHAAVLAPVDAR